ncbi:MAG: type II toxin-antitoxin system HipA family toxin [Clostridiales bacterium]|nr:type II toxin-antitoxin system HipA family toxin [Clostridiales bacterium]
MKSLTVLIEIRGKSVLAGYITGDHSQNATFTYAESYLSSPENRPLSLSLPFSPLPYSPEKTQCFFDGLLPEGYTRRCVAEEVRTDVQDYLTLLAKLGEECLGAIQITGNTVFSPKEAYQKLTQEQLLRFAREGAGGSAALAAKSHLSLTGASGKTGLYLDDSKNQWYLPIGTAPSTHIVKQSHVRLEKIVTNEQLCLLTAGKLGIDVPESHIICTDNPEQNHMLFATRRYDRKFSSDNRTINGMPAPYRLHQEDFAQALGLPAILKYEKNQEDYLAKMFLLLKNHSSSPLEDQLRLWDICVFNYLIGNTDNHLKNLSLLYSEDLKAIRLAPAYDILSTRIYENSTDEMALSIGGVYRIDNITRESFLLEAGKIGLGKNMAQNRIDKMVSLFESALLQSASELQSQGFTDAEDIAGEIWLQGKTRTQRLRK